MADIVDARTRSRMMSKINGSNTRPEKAVRSALHRHGLRFRLYRKDLPGKPDIVLPAFDTAVFVHGCFWHCHDCKYFRLPKSNQEFWRSKLTGNQKRDQRNIKDLCDLNWYVGIVWECCIRDQTCESIEKSMDKLVAWIRQSKYRRRMKVIG